MCKHFQCSTTEVASVSRRAAAGRPLGQAGAATLLFAMPPTAAGNDLDLDDDDFAFDESALRQVDRLETNYARKPAPAGKTMAETMAGDGAPRNKTAQTIASTDIPAAASADAGAQIQKPSERPAAHLIDLSSDFEVDDDALLLEQADAMEKMAASSKPGFNKQPAPIARPQAYSMKNVAGPSSRPFPRTVSGEHASRAAKGRDARLGDGPLSSSSSSSSSSGRQLTLFGDVAPQQTAPGVLIQSNNVNGPMPSQSSSPRRKARQVATSQQQKPFLTSGHRFHGSGEQDRAKTKQWDFAQPMVMKRKPAFSVADELDLDEDAAAALFDGVDDELRSEGFELAPPPLEPPSVQGLISMKVHCDREAAGTWIYPTNKEMRDYQFNIVQRALFNNVLVALPTGLGKTFIAAVIILNYFRWFPEGKIIFVAPTKPLVAQQQQACHGICGLPWETATEMTGELKVQRRAEEWKTKRIFYMTPQTFENDLCSDLVDAEDIVCVVVGEQAERMVMAKSDKCWWHQLNECIFSHADEAHHATGNYAYGKVIRHLMPRNPFFRVLALTATPGSRPEQVQEVIDSLHINYIEIRSEASLDIRKYIRAKDEDPVVVPLGGVVAELRDKMVQLMRPDVDKLVNAGLLKQRDPVSIAPYAVTAIYQDPRKRAVVNQRHLHQAVSDLGALARALDYLIRYSVSMFASRMLALESGADEAAKGKKATQTRQKRKYSQNTIVRDMRHIFEDAQDQEGVVLHPKMEYLQNVIAAHFANEEEQGRAADKTRVMVFCSFRECVNELVTILNRVKGVSATVFVGQSSDSKGNRGMTQKDQERIVRDFKSGAFNVLVSTSIGEEGLDIGEVDLIVNYEAIKNSTRMLQRDGRTGRKRDGRIVTLMAEGPEERNWQHSKDNYKNMQHDIIKGVSLSLFDDVERLVPDDIGPKPVLKEVDQPPFEPSMIRANSMPRKQQAAKRKRDPNPRRNVPRNALDGFVKVSDMRKSKKGKQKRVSIREADDEDSGDDDRAIAAASEAPAGSGGQAPPSDSSDDDEVFSRGIVMDDFPSSTSRNGGRTSSSSSAPCSVRRTSGRSLGAGRPRVALETQLLSSSPLQDAHRPSAAQSPRRNQTALNEAHLNRVQFSDDASPNSLDKAMGALPSPALELGDSSPVVLRRRGAPHPLIAQLVAAAASQENETSGEVPAEADAEACDSPLVVRRRRRKLVRPTSVRSSPSATAMGPPSDVPISRCAQGRNSKTGTTPASDRPGKNHQKRVGDSPTSRRLFQLEADRSTDEERHGERDEDDEGEDRWIEDSSDREHVGDFAPTQAPKGYNQTAIYMQSVQYVSRRWCWHLDCTISFHFLFPRPGIY